MSAISESRRWMLAVAAAGLAVALLGGTALAERKLVKTVRTLQFDAVNRAGQRKVFTKQIVFWYSGKPTLGLQKEDGIAHEAQRMEIIRGRWQSVDGQGWKQVGEQVYVYSDTPERPFVFRGTGQLPPPPPNVGGNPLEAAGTEGHRGVQLLNGGFAPIRAPILNGGGNTFQGGFRPIPAPRIQVPARSSDRGAEIIPDEDVTEELRTDE